MKKALVIFVLLITISGFSQALNGYKYVIVPAKFDFLKEADQYKLNTVTKLYLENFGFKTFYDSDKLPPELIDKNCDKLFVDVDENNSMFNTKIKINFKDCRGTVLFISAEGSSRSKEYAVAYNEAFRMALKSIVNANYKYQEKKEANLKELSNAPTNVKTTSENVKTFSAVAISNGYTLVDDNKQAVFQILKTSISDLFLAKSFDNSGILIKKGKDWFFEYYKNENLQSEEIHLWTEIETRK
jgi:hypothetical protein